MKILVIGEAIHFEECREKLGNHEYTHLQSYGEAEKILTRHEVIFDFMIDETPASFGIYAGKPVTVFLNTCNISLSELSHNVNDPLQCTVFGFNGLPTMFNRQFLEVSVSRPDDKAPLKKICAELNTGYLLVEDRIGLVTPRVICMIINEAYFTVQDGTASRQDIDLAMKLGTNYPFGPFEWCQRIGLKNVYKLLEAIYKDTNDERYKISALMKKEYLGIKAPGIGH
ncbi:MAG: 3-hydroxyacyl-CoA dehydrogenase family protein [Cyclobacteriaceae bacterium]